MEQTSSLITDNTGQSIVDKLGNLYDALNVSNIPATTATLGIVKPDNDTIHVAADGTLSAAVGETVLPVPTASQTTFTYNGSQITLNVSYDSTKINATGLSATNAGSYTATFSLKNNQKTMWNDGTTEDKSIAWTINKATGSISISPSSLSLSTSTSTGTITVTAVGDGTISVSSNDTSVATVSPSTLSGSGSVTVTGLATGSATITITQAEGTNYTAGGSKTCSISAQFTPMKTFAAATDSEIAQMVAAADAGQIDLYEDCGWRVGQEHQTTISAIASSGTYDGVSWSVGESQPQQTITLVLMHRGDYQLVTPVKDKNGSSRSTCSFVVGVKDCLSNRGYMNRTDTNSGSWRAMRRRNWCNGGFRSALSASLQSVFKQFQCITGTWSNNQAAGGSNITTQDYFALFAGREIFNGGSGVSYSTSNEAHALFPIAWYTTTSNRIKQVNGSANNWWERSPFYENSSYFCRVGSAGSASYTYAATSLGLAPFGCL